MISIHKLYNTYYIAVCHIAIYMNGHVDSPCNMSILVHASHMKFIIKCVYVYIYIYIEILSFLTFTFSSCSKSLPTTHTFYATINKPNLRR